MNTYEAKFAREAKPRPSDWVIAKNCRGLYLQPLKPEPSKNLAASAAKGENHDQSDL